MQCTLLCFHESNKDAISPNIYYRFLSVAAGSKPSFLFKVDSVYEKVQTVSSYHDL